jgi:hypothetical protein
MPGPVEPVMFLPPGSSSARPGFPAPASAERARPGDWSAVAERLQAIADELQAIVGEAPPSNPDAEQGRAIRSATGRISADIGTLKRRVGVGQSTRSS